MCLPTTSMEWWASLIYLENKGRACRVWDTSWWQIRCKHQSHVEQMVHPFINHVMMTWEYWCLGNTSFLLVDHIANMSQNCRHYKWPRIKIIGNMLEMNFVAYYLSFRPSTVIKSHAFKLNHLQDLKLWYLCHASSSSKGSAGILLLSSLLRFEHKKCPLELELVGAELLKIFNQPVNTEKKNG